MPEILKNSAVATGLEKVSFHSSPTERQCQRILSRDKDFLSEQCKETEETNRMGKPRDLFNKIRDTKGIFHAKWGQ